MLRGKVALITGCNRGLGAELMKEFSKNGAMVFAHSRSYSTEFENEIERIKEENNTEIVPIYFDLTNSDEMKSGMQSIKDIGKRVDILVNSAGVSHSSLFQLTSIQKAKDVFDINFFAALELSQYVSKIMMKNKNGVIVNITSILGEDSFAGNCAYGTSKAALIALTRVMAIELAPFGIRVNSVALGPTEVGMVRSLSEKALQEQIKCTAMKRQGRALEIAYAIMFLSSDKASYITGQNLRVDGGFF